MTVGVSSTYTLFSTKLCKNNIEVCISQRSENTHKKTVFLNSDYFHHVCKWLSFLCVGNTDIFKYFRLKYMRDKFRACSEKLCLVSSSLHFDISFNNLTYSAGSSWHSCRSPSRDNDTAVKEYLSVRTSADVTIHRTYKYRKKNI